MAESRITNHPILGPQAQRQLVPFTFNEMQLQGMYGEPIAAALLANGIRKLRDHEESGTPRGFYCAIGHCMECRVEVADKGYVRACLTALEPGMQITSYHQLPNDITGRK